MATSVPPVPYNTPLLDSNGKLTVPWIGWFRQLFIRVGGNNASLLTNPMTQLGDMIYGGASGDPFALSGDTSNVRKFIRTLSVTGVATAPVWDTLVAGDIPALSYVTSIAVTVPSFLSVGGSPVTSSGTIAITLSGTALPIANGGTGQTTAAAAFNALSPLTTLGDIIYGSVSGAGTRLAGPTSATKQFLTSTGTGSAAQAPVYGTIAAGDLPTIALTGDVTGSASGGNITTTVAKINGTTVSGTTGSSNVVFSSAPTLTNPVVGTQSQFDGSTKAASTSYVDTAVSNAIAGVNPAVATQAATTAASDTSGFTYSNGVSGVGATFTGTANTAVTIDGYTFTALGQRLLVKNDTQSPSGAFNGVYYVTQIQTALLAPIFTRTLDYDAPSDMNNTGAIPVINGTVNGTTSWVLTSLVVTVGTTPLTFVEFTRNPADYLLKANNLSDVSSTSTAFNTLSPMSASGDVIYGGASGAGTRLAGNTTTTKKFLTQTGNGAASAAPSWGVLVGSDLPNPSSSTLGGIQSYAAVSNQWINTISTSGVPSSSQPAFSNLSGNLATAQLPTAQTWPASGTVQAITPNQYGVILSGSAAIASVLAPDASTTKVLISGGASANPVWGLIVNANLSGSAAITNANLAAMNDTTIKGNFSGGSATPSDIILSAGTGISLSYGAGTLTISNSGSVPTGLTTNNASSGNQTVSTGTALFSPYLSIRGSDTYTVQTDAELIGVTSLTISGTLVVNGTGEVRIL